MPAGMLLSPLGDPFAQHALSKSFDRCGDVATLTPPSHTLMRAARFTATRRMRDAAMARESLESVLTLS